MNNCISIKYSFKYKCILYDLFNNSILILFIILYGYFKLCINPIMKMKILYKEK